MTSNLFAQELMVVVKVQILMVKFQLTLGTLLTSLRIIRDRFILEKQNGSLRNLKCSKELTSLRLSSKAKRTSMEI